MKNRSKRALCLILALVLLFPAAPIFAPQAAQIAAYRPGDVNADGQVTTSDARLALRAAIGLDKFSADEAMNADADRSGGITTADARLILREAIGLDKPTPVTGEGRRTEELKGDARKPYESKDYELISLCSVTLDGKKHTILDDYATVTVPTPDGATEEDLKNVVGVTFNDEGEPFFLIPDAEARAKGKISFKTTHFSLFGAAKLTDEQLLDLWAERAAAQSTVRRISEEDITPGLAEMLNDCGLASNQYAGAIVRSILSLDTRGEILTAAIDGDAKTLRAKLVNFAGEFFLGKIFKAEEDEFLTQSLGENADFVKQAVKDGKYKDALTEIVKNIEKNMFSYVNYADKIASLTDKLADIWTDDMMNEQYEVYKELGGVSITDDDWNLVYVQLRGAAHRLSSRGVTAADLRKKFEQRAKNEAKIAAAKKELLADAAEWRELGLLNTNYWYNSLGDYPSDIERLNSLRQIRETLRSLLTLNGKFQRGKGYMTDKDFLTDAMFSWVTNGIKGRANFYKWLRDQGVYLPNEEILPPGVDPGSKTLFMTPVDAHSRQYYGYMDDVEQLVISLGKRAMYVSPDGKNTMRVTIPDEQGVLADGITVTGLKFSFQFTGRGWSGSTGSCSFTWTKPWIINEGDPDFEIRQREEHTFTANSVSVSANDTYVFLTFTGTEESRLYERNRETGEYLMHSGYPFTRNCDFLLTFAY